MKNLFTAIVEAQKEMPHITFDAKVKVRMKSGGEYTFEYASLPHVLGMVKSVLSKNGLAIVQSIEGEDLITDIVHSSGESKTSKTKLPFKPEHTSQERGAVITYFRRMCINALLCLAADDDNDNNENDAENFQKSRATTPPKKEITLASQEQILALKMFDVNELKILLDRAKVDNPSKLTFDQADKAIKYLAENMKNKKESK
jgi:hypothetical protein